MTAKDRRDGIPLLVVDLDGTLIRSDMLFESFWAGLSENWQAIPAALRGLARGRAALKRSLADVASLEVEHLPYNEIVLDYIRDWRASGGRAVLVTASDQSIADRIAAHLDLFDEVHGSNGEVNLKGHTKAEMIRERFGGTGYAYIGDSAADIPVWQGARHAVTMDAPAVLRRRLAEVGKETENLDSGVVPAYVAALRPHQWLKNILVFVPVIAAHATDPVVLLKAVLAFAAFSLVSSSGYVLNDLMDLRADRTHPRKSQRPLASGRVPIAHGTLMVPLLLLAGLALAAVGGMPLLAVIGAYFVLTTLYSFFLKQIAVADICTLAGLYTMRIIAGGLATGLAPSVWLLAFSIFFFVALAAIKRQAELVDLVRRGMPAARRRGYHVDDLPLVAQMSTASGYVSVMVLALYLNSPAVQELYTTPWLLWGICLVVLYWITRIALITSRGQMDDDPIVFAMRDRTSIVCILFMACFVAGAALI
ncbi:UbiA family prenyltransferase [Roseovarius salis]|uniref:UbiA family prenyltransferase n=1 Tax=Roseovarius salis TaxID=3376063 RepID=UPI0037C6C963